MAKKKETEEKKAKKKAAAGAKSKSAAGKAPAKKATAKSSAGAKKKTAARKTSAKKTGAKKTTAKKSTAKKAATRKAGAKKTAAKKSAAKKKTATKKSAPKKKSPAKKTPARGKAATKKSAAKKSLIAEGADTMKVESAKFDIQAHPREAYKIEKEKITRELPQSYGDTRIRLLVRDPEWIYAYWEINDDARKEHGLEGRHDKSMALRVFDVTDVDFDGSNAHRSYDVIINDYTMNWYLRLPEVNRNWCVDLGYYEADSGDFVTLARSNVVQTPRSGVTEEMDEQWMNVTQEYYEEILRLSGGFRISPMELRGSEGALRQISERLRVQVEEAGGASGAVASGATLKKKAPGDKEFWLVVNTDLIVYGATEPDAKLTIQGREAALRKDGSFSVRFTLPDGALEIPVKAVNADGDREAEITPRVDKETR